MSSFFSGFEKQAFSPKEMAAIKGALKSGPKKALSGPKIEKGVINYSSIHQPHEGMTHNQFLSKTSGELIRGGKADGRRDSEYRKDQLEMGRKIEMEHTNDPAKANEIVKDHLEEFPDYYTRLKKMEDKAKQEKTAFEVGFEKNAGLFRQVGKSKVWILGTPTTTAAQESSHLARLMTRQGLPDIIIDRTAKSYGVSKGVVRDSVRKQISGMGTIGGTIAGDKSYVGRHFSNAMARYGVNAPGLRDVVHHESFHHVPVLGKSEFLAHMWGGLKSKKGTLSPLQAAKDVGTFVTSRPGRAAAEAGVAGGGAYGGYKGVQALTHKSETGAEKQASIPWKSIKSHAAAAGLGAVGGATGLAYLAHPQLERQRRVGQHQIISYLNAPEEDRAIRVNPFSPEESAARTKALGY